MNRFALHVELISVLLSVVAVSRVSGDAMVVTKAMSASTIAEIYIEEEQVRAEIEVGTADLLVFRNVLPDDLYESLTGEAHAMQQRLSTFVQTDWVLLAEHGPLIGKVESVVPRKRISRDEITGEPLAVQPENGELVIRIEVVYPLTTRPAMLKFRSPGEKFAAANIGFVVYHQGVAVNDFRYLSREETLDLDWDDPWHSRFRNRNLRRRFDSPMSVFLYVEHFEVRKEIIIRPKDLQTWVDLGLGNAATIPIDKQANIKSLAAEFLTTNNPVTIDGKVPEGELDRIHFIRRTLRKTGVIDPPEELDLTSATLGVIFVYPIPKLPQEVSMTWQLFTPKLTNIPAATTDEAGGLPASLSPADPVLRWENFLTNPKVPAMLAVPPPPAPPRIRIPLLSVACGLAFLGIVTVAVWNREPSRAISRSWLAACLALICGLASMPLVQTSVTNPFVGPASPDNEDADAILAGLLHNTYRAFDRREEKLVYDRLSMSFAGDLLTDVYLQTRHSMELEGQGGARVKVDSVEPLETQSKGVTNTGGFIRRARWNVAGSVGHWGHTHQRTNQYEADFTIEPVDARWKVTEMKLLDQQRLDRPRVAGGR